MVNTPAPEPDIRLGELAATQVGRARLGTMRARPTVRLPALAVLLSAAVLGSVGLAGCGAVGDAQRVMDRSSLVNDLANRLAQAGSLTYTATYQLRDGQTGTLTQAQHPSRAAFSYPDGRLVVTPDWTADCRGEGGSASCALTPPPSPDSDVPKALLDAVAQRGLIPPTTVVGLLGAAALDADATINEHDTTVAGQYATCVDVSGIDNTPAAQFSACITAAGVLASFTGDVNNQPVDIRLTRYQPSAEESAFALPTGAHLTGSPLPGHS
jgi:hypothetical protein